MQESVYSNTTTQTQDDKARSNMVHRIVTDRLSGYGIRTKEQLIQFYVLSGCTRTEAKNHTSAIFERRVLDKTKKRVPLDRSVKLIAATIGLPPLDGIDTKKLESPLDMYVRMPLDLIERLRKKNIVTKPDLFRAYIDLGCDAIKALRYTDSITRGNLEAQTSSGMRLFTAWNILDGFLNGHKIELAVAVENPAMTIVVEPPVYQEDYIQKLESLAALAKEAQQKIAKTESSAPPLPQVKPDKPAVAERKVVVHVEHVKREIFGPTLSFEPSAHHFKAPNFLSQEAADAPKGKKSLLRGTKLPNDLLERMATCGLQTEQQLLDMLIAKTGNKQKSSTYKLNIMKGKILIAQSCEFNMAGELLMQFIEETEEKSSRPNTAQLDAILRWEAVTASTALIRVPDILALRRAQEKRLKSIEAALRADLIAQRFYAQKPNRAIDQLNAAKAWLQRNKKQENIRTTEVTPQPIPKPLPKPLPTASQKATIPEPRNGKKVSQPVPQTPSEWESKDDWKKWRVQQAETAQNDVVRGALEENLSEYIDPQSIDAYDELSAADKEEARKWGGNDLSQASLFLRQGIRANPPLSDDKKEILGKRLIVNRRRLVQIALKDALTMTALTARLEKKHELLGADRQPLNKEQRWGLVDQCKEHIHLLTSKDPNERTQAPKTGEVLLEPLFETVAASYLVMPLREIMKRTLPKAKDKSLFQDFSSVVKQLKEDENKLVATHLKHIIQVIGRTRKFYTSNWIDMVNEGSIGCLKAAQKWDHRLGFSFMTYSTWWINQAATRANNDTRSDIRMPVHAQEVSSQIYKERMKHLRETGESLKDEELADHLNITIDKIRDLDRVLRNQTSLDADTDGNVPTEDGKPSLMYFLSSNEQTPEDRVTQSNTTEVMNNVLSSLTEKQRKILCMRFGIGCAEHTLEEVGEKFGVTRERIRQLEKQALNRLRHPARKQKLAALRPDTVTPK